MEITDKRMEELFADLLKGCVERNCTECAVKNPCGIIGSLKKAGSFYWKYREYNPGDHVRVKIYSHDMSRLYYETGIVKEIVPPIKLQSTRYNINMDDGKTELKEVDPTCMNLIQ